MRYSGSNDLTGKACPSYVFLDINLFLTGPNSRVPHSNGSWTIGATRFLPPLLLRLLTNHVIPSGYPYSMNTCDQCLLPHTIHSTHNPRSSSLATSFSNFVHDSPSFPFIFATKTTSVRAMKFLVIGTFAHV